MSKRIVGFITKESGVCEILPKAFGLYNKANRRWLVLEMLNSYLPEAARFGETEKRACMRQDLYTICYDKLMELSEQDENHEALRRYSALFSRDGKFELRLNLDDAFLRLVHRRILLKQPEETVTMHRDHIIIDNGVRTVIHPVWKHTKTEETLKHRRMVREGVERFKGSDHDQIYLVYPKNDDFKRHIPVQTTGDDKREERMLKLIPYSFSFCSKSKCKGKSCK